MTQEEQGDKSAGVRVNARLRLRFPDTGACEAAGAALAPESEGFLDLRVDGCELQIDVPFGSTGRVLSSVDDVLCCLQAALASKDAAASGTGDDEAPQAQ